MTSFGVEAEADMLQVAVDIPLPDVYPLGDIPGGKGMVKDQFADGTADRLAGTTGHGCFAWSLSHGLTWRCSHSSSVSTDNGKSLPSLPRWRQREKVIPGEVLDSASGEATVTAGGRAFQQSTGGPQPEEAPYQEDIAMKALILSADGFEDSELLVPLHQLREAGYAVEVVAEERGSISGKHGHEVRVDRSFAEVDPADFAVLILPGGRAPAAIRHEAAVLAIVRAFSAADKPIGAICHGPLLLVSAGVLGGRRATCYRSIAQELRDAGAEYLDAEVVVDGKLVTSRQPGDLPAFMGELMRLLRP